MFNKDNQTSVAPYVTKLQIADYLQLRPRTIDRWMTEGMPHYRLGARRTRFKISEVEEWMRRNHRIVQRR